MWRNCKRVEISNILCYSVLFYSLSSSILVCPFSQSQNSPFARSCSLAFSFTHSPWMRLDVCVSQQCCFSCLVCVSLLRWTAALYALSPPAVSQPSVHNWLQTWEYTAALRKERQKGNEGRRGRLRVLITIMPYDLQHNDRRKGSVVTGIQHYWRMSSSVCYRWLDLGCWEENSRW